MQLIYVEKISPTGGVYQIVLLCAGRVPYPAMPFVRKNNETFVATRRRRWPLTKTDFTLAHKYHRQSVNDLFFYWSAVRIIAGLQTIVVERGPALVGEIFHGLRECCWVP